LRALQAMLERELDPHTEERLHQDLARTFSDERLTQIKCKRYPPPCHFVARARACVRACVRCGRRRARDVARSRSLNVETNSRIDSRLVQQRIFNVLKAFCLMYTNVTYEQGMSFIAGVLVLLTDEEVRNNNRLRTFSLFFFFFFFFFSLAL
jgi:hypothetical protein